MRQLLIAILISLYASNASGNNKATLQNLYGEFIPKGWILESEINRDVDGDGVKDATLVIIQKDTLVKTDTPKSGNRTLILLMGTKKGRFNLTATAKDLLICSTCAGMMSSFRDAEPYVDYEEKVLVVNWLEGSRESREITLRFGYDLKVKNLVLLSDKVESTDRNTGKSIITQRDFIAGKKTVDGKSEKMKKQTLTIDKVKYEDY